MARLLQLIKKLTKIFNCMKKIFLLFGMLLFAASAFCQEPLTKDQNKKLKAIQKEATTELNKLVANDALTPDEKKRRVVSMKNDRNAKMAEFMGVLQVEKALTKDPVKWDAAMKQIDKNEANRLKAEKQKRLDEIASQQKELNKQQSELDRQMKELKGRQDKIKEQQKALKNKAKEVKKEYK